MQCGDANGLPMTEFVPRPRRYDVLRQSGAQQIQHASQAEVPLRCMPSTSKAARGLEIGGCQLWVMNAGAPVKSRLTKSGAVDWPEVNFWRNILATFRPNEGRNRHSRKVDRGPAKFMPAS